MSLDYSRPQPLIEGPHTQKEIDDVIAAPMERPHHREFFIALAISLTGLGIFRDLGGKVISRWNRSMGK